MHVDRVRIAIAALIVMLILPWMLAAQSQAAGATQGPAVRQGKVYVAGANPGIRLFDKEGGNMLSTASFWRVNWRPAGPGHICYVTVGDEKAGGLRIALTDNEKLLDLITNDMFGHFAPEYKTRPFKVYQAVIKTTRDTATERVENCKSEVLEVLD